MNFILGVIGIVILQPILLIFDLANEFGGKKRRKR